MAWPQKCHTVLPPGVYLRVDLLAKRLEFGYPNDKRLFAQAVAKLSSRTRGFGGADSGRPAQCDAKQNKANLQIAWLAGFVSVWATAAGNQMDRCEAPAFKQPQKRPN